MQREREEREAKLEELRGERRANEWGSQIRSYTLNPFQLVKDHRTGVETGNTDGVLEGDIEPFIWPYLQARGASLAERRVAVPPRVDVVMVSWNDKANVATALESVFALGEVQADPGFANVVVSDNGSTDGTIEFLRERYAGRVTVIENGANLGFGAACNRAFAQTSAPYVFLAQPRCGAEESCARRGGRLSRRTPPHRHRRLAALQHRWFDPAVGRRIRYVDGRVLALERVG